MKTLFVDAVYRSTNNPTMPQDEFDALFRFSDGRGINNTSGFRPKSKAGESTAITDCCFCVIVTNYGEVEWPDSLDLDTGQFTYYGDNRQPGKALTETRVGGNLLLEKVFTDLHDGRRSDIPPFLCFEKFKGADGVYMRFLGLAVPGAPGVSSLDDLVAIWKRRGSQRFQNYRAIFTILDESSIERSWLDEIVAGRPPIEAEGCPPAFVEWVKTGIYRPLCTQSESIPRSKLDQLPKSKREWDVLNSVLTLTNREFEYAAKKLVELMDPRYRDARVTREVQDGGRDVLAVYYVGHDSHSVALEVSVEAKRWKPDSPVGVKPMMRLISRLKHRDFGIFITTSYFQKQVQQELIEDGHPVVLVAGGDIARMLIAKEIEGEVLERWLHEIRETEQV